MRLTDDMAKLLGCYVYVYIDPRNGRVFYIGRGKGSRLYAHLEDQADTAKTATIADIRSSGKEPQIDILRYGLSDSEAAVVEAACIDLIGTDRLTNRVSGYHEGSYGRIRANELWAILAAKPVEVHHRAILITINRLYRSGMTPAELYEATRGIWVVGRRREKAEYAMAVYQGVVREVYRIGRWYPAGTLDYETRDASGFRDSGRWEFSGDVAYEIRDEYVGFSVGKGGQNPIRYVDTRW